MFIVSIGGNSSSAPSPGVEKYVMVGGSRGRGGGRGYGRARFMGRTWTRR